MTIELTDLVPLTIHVPAATLIRLTAIGRMRPDPARPQQLIEALVDRAVHTPGRAPVASDNRPPVAPDIHRSLDTLTGGDSMQMLALRLSGYTTGQIAHTLGLSVADTATHFQELDSAHHRKTHRQPRNRQEAIA